MERAEEIRFLIERKHEIENVEWMTGQETIQTVCEKLGIVKRLGELGIVDRTDRANQIVKPE